MALPIDFMFAALPWQLAAHPLDLARLAVIVRLRQGQGMFSFILAFMVLPSWEMSASISAVIFMPDAVKTDLAMGRHPA